jgi:hypothetical protein
MVTKPYEYRTGLSRTVYRAIAVGMVLALTPSPLMAQESTSSHLKFGGAADKSTDPGWSVERIKAMTMIKDDLVAAKNAARTVEPIIDHPIFSPPTGLEVRTADLRGEAAQVRSRIPQGYQEPTGQEKQAFRTVVELILEGKYAKAAEAATSLNYDVEEIQESGRNMRVVALSEKPGPNGRMRGWGSYFFNLDSHALPLVVQAPHPVDDIGTPQLAADLFVDSNAAVFMLSGSDRDYADAAHDRGMFFNEAHIIVSRERPGATVCQIHGFDRDAHPEFPRSAQAIISNADGMVSDAAARVDTALRSKNIKGFVFNRLPGNHPVNRALNDGLSGDTFRSLGATRNLQWNTTRPRNGQFIHVELAWEVRNGPGLARQTAQALSSAFRGTLHAD